MGAGVIGSNGVAMKVLLFSLTNYILLVVRVGSCADRLVATLNKAPSGPSSEVCHFN